MDRNKLSLLYFVDLWSTFGFCIGAIGSVFICLWLIDFGEIDYYKERRMHDISDDTLELDKIHEPLSSSTIEELISIASPSRRRAHLHTVLQGKSEWQIVDLIRLSMSFDFDNKLRVLQNQLFKELARINPQNAFSHVWETEQFRWYELLSIVFTEWGILDFPKALREAAELDGSLRTESIRSILSAHDNYAKTELNVLAQQLGVASIVEKVVAEENARNMMDEPKEAIRQILTDGVSNQSQLNLLVDIAKIWTSIDGSEVFRPLFQLLQTEYDGDAISVQRIVECAVENDPQNAWNVLMNMDQETQERIHRGILNVWVRVDPYLAFESVEQFANKQRHINVRNSVLSEWSKINPAELINNVQRLPEIHHATAIADAVGEIARQESVKEAIRTLQLMKRQGRNVSQTRHRLVLVWVQTDPAAAVEWILDTSENENDAEYLLNIAMPRLALADPDRAMEVALEQPINDPFHASASGFDYQVIDTLASAGRFEEARTMLERVREPLRWRSYYLFGLNLLDFNKPDDVLELIHDRWNVDQEDYFSTFAVFWLKRNPSQLVEYIGRLPTEEMQRRGARIILKYRDVDLLLTENQIDYLNKYIGNIQEK